MKRRFLLLVALSCNFSLNANITANGNELASDGAQLQVAQPAVSADNKQSEDLTLEQIMERALTAYGGRAELSKFRSDCFLKGKITFAGDKGIQFGYEHVRKDDFWRTDVTTDDKEGSSKEAGVRINGFDGASYWQSDRQKSEYLPQDQAAWLKAEEGHKPFLLTNWLEPGYSFRLLGPTLFEQVPVWAIEVSQKDEPATTIYLDRSNYVAIALTYHLAEPGDSKLANIVWHYSEYRPVLNSVYPFQATESIDDHPVLQLDIARCENAIGVGRDFFNKPGAARIVRLSEPITLPFDYSQGQIILKAELDDGDRLLFLVDTGTSETIIDRRLAAQHLLAKGTTFKISGLKGDVSTQTTRISRLKIGKLILNDIDAKIADLSQQSQKIDKEIAGIIGMNVIGNYQLTIDYGTPSLTFADSQSKLGGSDTSVVPLVSGKDPLVKVGFSDNDWQTLLMDTGAAFNHLASGVAKPYLSTQDNQAGQRKQVTGLDGNSVQLGTVTIDTVKVGTQAVHKVPFTYPTDSTSKSNIIFGMEDAAGVLGNPFWQNFVVTLDMASRRLFLKPNPTVSSKLDMERNISAGDGALTNRRDFRLAEISYQKALVNADRLGSSEYQAVVQGRLGNLRRIMAHDLHRAEHAQSAYNYFSKADELARKVAATKIEGRILADWSLLYSDNGQLVEARQTIEKALLLAPEDASVNVDFAVHLFRARQFGEMQKYVEKALILEPNNWQALWYQLKLGEMFGDATKQKETLAQIVRFYPWSKVAVTKLNELAHPKVVKPTAVQAPATN